MRLHWCVVLLGGTMLASCAESTGPGTVATVTVAGAPTLLETGQTALLSATARAADGTVMPAVEVTWSAEGTAITVDSTGFLTAVAPGSARAVAVVGGVAGALALTVEPPTVVTVTVAPESTIVLAGDAVQLAASARSRAGAVLADAPFVWRSADPMVATVGPTGLVVGVAAGTTRVSATSGDVAGTAVVTVRARPGITITASTTTPRQGDVLALAVSDGQGGMPVDPARFVWTVRPASAGHVTPGGAFVGYEPGAARVVAAADADTATIDLTIVARGVSGTFSPVGHGTVSARYTSDLWVHGTHAYTGTWGNRDGNRGDRMYVWSVATPSAPVITDSVVVAAGTVNDVKVAANGALAVITHEGAADGLNGITILSLADPAHPTVVTRYTTNLTTGVHNVWIDGSVVYAVTDGAVGLRVVDVANPAAPVEIAAYYADSSVVHDVYVRDGLAFVSHWDVGLVILDVGNGIRGGAPSDPKEVSRLALGGQTHNAWYWPAAGYVFVGEEDFGTPGYVHVVDVRDLAQPVEVASFRLPAVPPHNFWVEESRGVLYVGWYDHGLRAIDVSGRLLGELDRQGRAIAALSYGTGSGCPGTQATCTWAPQLHGGLIYASDMNLGLRIVAPGF